MSEHFTNRCRFSLNKFTVYICWDGCMPSKNNLKSSIFIDFRLHNNQIKISILKSDYFAHHLPLSMDLLKEMNSSGCFTLFTLFFSVTEYKIWTLNIIFFHILMLFSNLSLFCHAFALLPFSSSCASLSPHFFLLYSFFSHYLALQISLNFQAIKKQAKKLKFQTLILCKISPLHQPYSKQA